MILERDAMKWFRPALGQFDIAYGPAQAEYQPDFVAETGTEKLILECKRQDQLTAPDVLAKKAAAAEWCRYATELARTCGDKPWRYALLPEQSITANATLDGLLREFSEQATSLTR